MHIWARNKFVKYHLSLRSVGQVRETTLAVLRSGAEDPLFLSNITVYRNFLSAEEENQLLLQIASFFDGKRFQKSHWDSVISGYREVERHESLWSESCLIIINRIKNMFSQTQFLQYIHVLELKEDGIISPHVDNTEVFGSVIATISLESDSVMTCEHVLNGSIFDVYIPRYSLYILRDHARYMYRHSILNREFQFGSQIISKKKRIAIILRSEKVAGDNRITAE